MSEQLVFDRVAPEAIVDNYMYLANVKGQGLVFGHFAIDTGNKKRMFYNEGYGYMDADCWHMEEVVGVYMLSPYAAGKLAAHSENVVCPFDVGTQARVDFEAGVLDCSREGGRHEPLA